MAVNRRAKPGQEQEADYFRVTVWRQLGETCHRFLQKGKKVCVIGPVSVSSFTGSDGAARASLELTADDVEFLSPKADEILEGKRDKETNYIQVKLDDDHLPF